MEDFIIIAILIIIVGLASGYVIKAKKSGKKCIGCPDGCCGIKGDKSSSCSCCCNQKTK